MYNSKMSENATPGAAERLLDTAARLFYTRGVSNVGINEIIARAGVARMTLYHHFASKDALIRAVLERRQKERDAWLRQVDQLAEDPTERLLAVFDLFLEWARAPDFRGCPLVAATFELGGQLNAARPYAQTHQATTRQYLTRCADEAGLREPEAIATQLQMLLEGASVLTLVSGNSEAAALAKNAAASLIVGARDD